MKIKIKNSKLLFSEYNFENELCGSGMRGYLFPITKNESVKINDVPTKTFEVVLETNEKFNGTISYAFSKNNRFNVDNSKKVVAVVKGIENIKYVRVVFPTYDSNGSYVNQYNNFNISADGIFKYNVPANVASIKFEEVSLGISGMAQSESFTGARKVSFKLYIVNKDVIIK